MILRIRSMGEIRLQKVLAQAGIGSRRACEGYIAAGRVNVNGQPAQLGMKVDPQNDHITFDGEPIASAQKLVYIALNKPPGVLSSLKSQGGLPTVIDHVQVPQRVYPVGRLDKDSEGLILLTNDGELAEAYMHPRYEHEKEYRVLLDRRPSPAELKRWREGLQLRDGFLTSPAKVWIENPEGKMNWVGVILKEGHKRQLRESARVLNLRVRRLQRIRIGPLELDDLKPGSWRYLRQEEIRRMKTSRG
ncbi:MAG: pseudouridine synthase [Anaerolineales bacterium]|jgi:23S rRNA pseudouridine2605 synthase